jgi:hypothetical protein
VVLVLLKKKGFSQSFDPYSEGIFELRRKSSALKLSKKKHCLKKKKLQKQPSTIEKT